MLMLNYCTVYYKVLSTAQFSSLTDVHHIVIHAVNRDHLHEVVGVVSLL